MKRGYSMVRRCCIRGCDGMAQPVDVVCARCAEELAALEAMDARPVAGYRGQVVEAPEPAWWGPHAEWVAAIVLAAAVLLMLWRLGDGPYPPGAEPPAYVSASDAQK